MLTRVCVELNMCNKLNLKRGPTINIHWKPLAHIIQVILHGLPDGTDLSAG